MVTVYAVMFTTQGHASTSYSSSPRFDADILLTTTKPPLKGQTAIIGEATADTAIAAAAALFEGMPSWVRLNGRVLCSPYDACQLAEPMTAYRALELRFSDWSVANTPRDGKPMFPATMTELFTATIEPVEIWANPTIGLGVSFANLPAMPQVANWDTWNTSPTRYAMWYNTVPDQSGVLVSSHSPTQALRREGWRDVFATAQDAQNAVLRDVITTFEYDFRCSIPKNYLDLVGGLYLTLLSGNGTKP